MNAKGFSHKTSIIILTYNNLDYNKPCIESIRKYTKAGTYEIVVVDNNSTDGTKEWLEEQNDLKVIFNTENVGFPKGCNQGISIAD
ncbi:MAG TPA: glycosyl transferase, partial [Lachnoclostridium sp.]|nr:glycosyl transferase [Lachnoclostridium sp.]